MGGSRLAARVGFHGLWLKREEPTHNPFQMEPLDYQFTKTMIVRRGPGKVKVSSQSADVPILETALWTLQRK